MNQMLLADIKNGENWSIEFKSVKFNLCIFSEESQRELREC